MIHVMDASAILVILRGEPGCDYVQELLQSEECSISSVNMAEVGSKLIDYGLPPEEFPRIARQLQIDIIDFNAEQSIQSAQIRKITRSAGLSLGDRACVALTQLMQGCVVTSDRAWLDISEAAGVKVIMIR
jgi:ribonuclease VapC